MAEPMRAAQSDDGDRLIEFAEQILGVPLEPWQMRLCRRVFGGNVGRSTGRPDAEQLTPTAEPDRAVITRNQIENAVRHVIEDGEWSDADDLPLLIVNAILFRGRYLPDVSGPPRLEELAPGTTFRIDREEVWTVIENRVAVCSQHHVGRYLDVFDPSTIRDVTPPPSTESTK